MFPEDAIALLRALDGEMYPLTQYFIGLKVGRLVTDEEMLLLADLGLVTVWARWWKGQEPSRACAYAITERGHEAIVRRTVEFDA